MKILRVIDGRTHEITLTELEKVDAMRESVLLWDERDILTVLKNYPDDRYKAMCDNLQNCPLLLERVACKYRENISDIPIEDRFDNILDSYNYVIGFIREED